MKKCVSCNTDKNFKLFTERSDRPNLTKENLSKYSSSCKACQALNTKLKFFGITKEQFNIMRESSGDCCEVCGLHESEVRNLKTKHYGLYIDHDHVTGKVRGLLCHKCNLILGHSNDSVDILNSAISYLKR